MTRFLWLFLSLTLFVTTSVAQDLRVQQKRLDRLQNIPASHIHRIMQDSEGYIWYATYKGGLCRDNGYQIDIFRSDRNHPDLIATNDVLCLTEFTGNRILFGTSYGAYLLDKKDYTIRPINDQLQGDVSVPNILVDNHNIVWIAYNQSVGSYTQDGAAIRSYDITSGGKSVSVKDIYIDSRGTIWVINEEGGLGHISGGNYTENFWPFAPIECMLERADGTYLIGTSGTGIIEFNGIFGKQIEGIRDTHFISLLNDTKREVLWATTTCGLRAYSCNGGEFTELPLQRCRLKDNLLLDQLYQDRQGNIWVAGYTPHTFVLSDVPSDIQRDHISELQQLIGANSKIENVLYTPPFFWMYESRTGVSAYSYFTQQMQIISHYSLTNVMTRTYDGGIWTTDSHNIYKIHRGWQHDFSVEPIVTDQFQNTSINYMEQYGDTLYIGTDTALYCLNLNTKHITLLYTATSSSEAISNVTPLSDGSLLALKQRCGAVLLSRGKVVPVTSDVRRIHPVFDSKRNRVWVVNRSGDLAAIDLAAINEGLSSPSREDLGGSGDPVRQILLDKGGHMWILYDKYITEYNPDTKYFRTLYGHDANIAMDNFQSCCETGDGVSVCGADGLCYIKHSNTIDSPQTGVQVKVSTYLANGQKCFVGVNEDRIEISPGITSLILHLTSNDKTNTDNITFAYRLKGINAGWTYLPEGRNTLSLLNLQKGTYTLQVMATDASCTWNMPMECITIVRHPAWWESWWAQTIYVILVVLTVVFIIHTYNVMHKRRERFYHMMALMKEFKGSEGSAASEASRDQEVQEAQRVQEVQTSLQREFLAKVIDCMDKNLSNQDYSVDRLSTDMCMSRMNLYRKLLSITGQTPTDFIKGYRLTKAAELVLTERYSITVVSEMTGFSSPSYFRKCFKEKYGVLPSNYREK